MKSREKIIQPNKPVFRRSESDSEKNFLENSLNKSKFASISLQQNLDYLQKQGVLFSRPFHFTGDANSYFKQTLRQYEYFDLSAFATPTSQRSTKSVKSLDSFKKKRPSKFQQAVKQKKRPKTPVSHLRPFSKQRSSVPHLAKLEEPSVEGKKDSEEPDLEVFYSPGSDTAQSSSRTLKNKSSESSLIEEPSGVSQEESEEHPIKDILPEESEEQQLNKEDPVEVVEDKELTAMGESAEEIEFEEEEEEGKPLETETEETEEETEGKGEAEEKGAIPEETEEEITDKKIPEVEETDEEEEEGRQPSPAGGDGSAFKFDPAIDAAVLRELEEAEKQAKSTAKIIYELKTRVTELLKKEKHTEAEAKELEEKNKELRAQMRLFEEKTKRIQFLIAQTNLFEKLILPETPLQVKHKEDILPKVIVCGMTENNIPKLILCDDKKTKVTGPKSHDVNIPKSVVPKFAKRLSDSYTMQEKLAAENADLEGMRYKLQSDLLNKDQTIEYLQRKLCSIQCEMRMLFKENTELNGKITKMSQIPPQREHSGKRRRAPCGKGKGPCPAELEMRLNEYSETTKVLEKQLCDMENDVKTMQTELTAVQAEREHLEQHKKVIVCPPMCLPHPPCQPCPPCSPCSPPPCSPCMVPCLDQQLREMQEKYCRLQDDFKGKVTEVAGLRADNEKLKTTAKDADEAKRALEEKVKDLERNVRTLRAELGGNKSSLVGSKEQMIEQEQQLAVAKQRFREAQDELEELRAFIQDQQGQLDDYRNKYLEAQQEVEEQKRQIDMLEMDANRVNEQVNLEIQRVKNQFQEKLQELTPLPDLLKATQIKLQETQQMHLLAERNNEALNRDLQIYKDKIKEITEQMEQARNDLESGDDQKLSLSQRIEQMELKINEVQEECDALKNQLEKTEDALDEAEREVQAKMHEIAQLSAQLESVREESARQVARNKERCETVRRSMQNQITDLERQLAQSRAQARTAQKDRDEIRQKMQAQINNLHENFEDAQMRIRNLQGHVNFLKDSYTGAAGPTGGPDEAASTTFSQDACNCGY